MRRYHPIAVLLLLLAMTIAVPVFAQEEPVTHIVQPGENLYRISLRYGVDLNELAQVNNITNQSRIFSGQVLTIPGLSVPDSSPEVENPLIAGTPVTHVVSPGESLSQIAQRYGVTVNDILQANNIPNPNRILRGQELQIWTTQAEGAPAEPENLAPELVEGPPPQTTITYVVQPGEHLSQIAQRYGMEWTTLAQVNRISNPNTVYSGQVLTIPAVNADGGIADMGIITPPPFQAPEPTIQQGRQIIVSLSDSRLYAYEDGMLVHSVLVSNGRAATPTVQGDFRVTRKVRAQVMSGPGYYLPNVEWVMYFYSGYAIHGTYWHSNWGQPMSAGCVNMPNEEARWLYENFVEVGTPVRVQP